MTLIIKLILILFIPITFAQASLFENNSDTTKNWEVRGFVFNTALQFWAKTSCRLVLSVPGSVAHIPSDCDENEGPDEENRGPDEEDSLLYYHGDNYPGDRINGGKISGVVRSKVFGDILFGDKIPNGKNCNLLRGNNNDRKTKIVKFQDGVVRVTGCAYIKKLDEYIYLSPFTPSSNSKKTLTGADSAWLGLTAEIKIDRGLNENLQDDLADDLTRTDGITGGNFLAILGCGWSPNFGYWNFGLKDLSGNNNNSGVTDCEFEPPSPRSVDQRIFDTRVGFEEPVRTGLTVPNDVVFGALGEISGTCATGFGGANIKIGEKPPTTYNLDNEKQISFSFKLLFVIPVTITLSCKNDLENIFIFSGALSSDVDVEATSNELIVTPQAVQGFGKVEVVSQISNTSPNDTKIKCSVNRGGVDNINTEIISFQYCGLLTTESRSQQLVLSDTTFVQECIKTELKAGSFTEDCDYISDTGIGSGLTDVTSLVSHKGTLYALVNDNAIYRINIVDGTKSSPISVNEAGFILLTSNGNNFYGILRVRNSADYRLYQISEQGVATSLSNLIVSGSPMVGLVSHKGTLYMVDENGILSKENLPNRTVTTVADLTSNGETIAGLVSYNEKLYVVNERGQVHQVDTTNGNLTFFANIVTQNINFGSLISHDGELYAKGETDNALYKVILQEITNLSPKTITVKALPTVIADRNKKSLPRGATARCRNGRIEDINIPANTNTLNIYYIQGDRLIPTSPPVSSNDPYISQNVLNNTSEFIVEVSNSKSAPFPVRTLLRHSDCEA